MKDSSNALQSSQVDFFVNFEMRTFTNTFKDYTPFSAKVEVEYLCYLFLFVAYYS